MQITNEEIEQAFKIGGAVAGGGALWKFLEFMSGRRKRKVDADSQVVNSAVKLVKTLSDEIEGVKNDLKKEEEERKKCLANFELLQEDLKGFYEHVYEHMRKCNQPLEIPKPKSLHID